MNGSEDECVISGKRKTDMNFGFRILEMIGIGLMSRVMPPNHVRGVKCLHLTPHYH